MEVGSGVTLTTFVIGSPVQFAALVSTTVMVYWPGVVAATITELPEPVIGVVIPFWVRVQAYVEPAPPLIEYWLVEFSQRLAAPAICKFGLGEASTVTVNGIELPKQFTVPELDSFTTMVAVPGVVQFTKMVSFEALPTMVPPVTVQLKVEPGVGFAIM